MNEFKLLAQRDGWIIVNHFIEIRRNPRRLLIYLLYIFWIGTLVFNSVIRYQHVSEMQLQSGPQILGAVICRLALRCFCISCIAAPKSSPFYDGGCTSLVSCSRIP